MKCFLNDYKDFIHKIREEGFRELYRLHNIGSVRRAYDSGAKTGA